jgi:hypothetical protein
MARRVGNEQIEQILNGLENGGFFLNNSENETNKVERDF